MLPPQKTEAQIPNAVYMPSLNIGMGLDGDGVPYGRVVSMLLQQAYVDPASGKWQKAGQRGAMRGFTFRMDEKGVVTGLPEDLQGEIAGDISQLWALLTTIVGKVNAVRKIA